MSKFEQISEAMEKPLDRRLFGKGIGIASLGVVASSFLGGTLSKAVAQTADAAQTAATAITDVDVLNFALNLEYLEAEFYTWAVTGKTLTQSGIIPSSASTGSTTGGQKVDFSASPQLKMIAEQIMDDEQEHVKFLRSALGSAGVKKPAIHLNALGFGFDNYKDFIKLARDFEDVGVSAYGGAAPLLKNKDYLAAAARIALTEAEHSGNIRLKMVLLGLHEPPVDSQDIPPTWNTLFSVGAKGLATVRSTSQVLHIVYAGGSCSGGFFPNGFNGTIKCA